MHLKLLLIILLALISLLPCSAADNADTPAPPTDCYQRYLRMPSADLLRHGYNFLYHTSHPDSAMLCFTIVAERSDQAVTRRQRLECFEAWCGRWEANNWAYNNYEASIEDFRRLAALQEKWSIKSVKPLYYSALSKVNEFNIDPAGNTVEDVTALMKQAFHKAIDLGDKDIALRSFGNLIRIQFFTSDDKLTDEHESLAELLGVNNRGFKIADCLHAAMCNYIDGNKSQAIANLDRAIALYDPARLDARDSLRPSAATPATSATQSTKYSDATSRPM